MTGSTETQSFDLDEYRHQDFDEYAEELVCDRERELAREDTLSPLLESFCKDLWMQMNQAVLRRQYRHSREWR